MVYHSCVSMVLFGINHSTRLETEDVSCMEVFPLVPRLRQVGNLFELEMDAKKIAAMVLPIEL